MVAQGLGNGSPILGKRLSKTWEMVSQSILAKRVPVSMLGVGSPSHGEFIISGPAAWGSVQKVTAAQAANVWVRPARTQSCPTVSNRFDPAVS